MISLLVLAGLALNLSLVKGQSITDLEKNKQDEIKKIEDQIKELEQKAQSYRQIITLKQSQEASLANQIAILEAEINQLETEITIYKNEIDDYNKQISDLENKISEKEEMINVQKKVLAELIRAYYEYDKRDVLNEIFKESKALPFTAKEDQLIQVSDRVGYILQSINALKASLEDEKKSLESKKSEVVDLYSKLEERSTYLENSKEEKESLVAQTKGEEKKYEKLLANIEDQKQELLGDIDELYSANTAEIDALAATLEKPTAGLASVSWYFSQKDSRWGNETIGISDSKMKDYGCAITSVAMVSKYYGGSNTPGSLCKMPVFFQDLINWNLTDWNSANIELSNYGDSHGNISWSVVDSELKKGNPVIVFIRAKKNAGHYVVIHHKNSDGRYVVHDPYFGPNIFLNSSIRLLSALYKKSISMSSVDQMIIYRKK